MNRAQVEGTALVLPLVALLASCSSPPQTDAGREPAHESAAQGAVPATPSAAPSHVRPALRGRVALPPGASLSVESSADHGKAPLAFDLPDGAVVEVLRSEIRSDDGAPSSYCEVKSSAGQGWIPEALVEDIRWDPGELSHQR